MLSYFQVKVEGCWGPLEKSNTSTAEREKKRQGDMVEIRNRKCRKYLAGKAALVSPGASVSYEG